MNYVGVIEKFYHQIWNKGNKDVAKDILAPDFEFRGSTGLKKKGIPQFLEYVDLIRSALTHYECTIQDIVADSHSVFAKMLFSGKHTGKFFGVLPTNKHVSWSGAALFKFSGDQVIDVWVLGDVDGLKQQLGIAEKISPG